MKIDPLALPDALARHAVLSIDLEDWAQLVTRRATGRMPEPSEHVVAQSERLLQFLDAHQIRATFFVMGTVAERYPNLVRAIDQAGHEIASHGYAHIPLFRLGPSEIAEDLRRSKAILEGAVGREVIGYRAPEFSVTSENMDVLGMIAEAGYRYDSSIFPIHHRRYGIASFPRTIARVVLAQGSLYELPLATYRALGVSLPIAGGGYFRLFPGTLLERTLRRLPRQGVLPMLYFHPNEFEPGDLTPPFELSGKPGFRAWHWMQQLGRKGVPRKVATVVNHFQFVTCREVLQIMESARLQESRSD